MAAAFEQLQATMVAGSQTGHLSQVELEVSSKHTGEAIEKPSS